MSNSEIVVMVRQPPIAAPAAGPKEPQSIKLAGLDFSPIFDPPRGAVAPPTAVEGRGGPPLGRFFRVVIDKSDEVGVLADLRASDLVRAAYVKPPVALPLWRDPTDQYLGEPAPGGPGPVPDFSGRQDYLAVAPHGVDARRAWLHPGGDGEGIQIIDIEGGWCLDHIDLTANGGLRGGDSLGGSWRDHGTAVLGVMTADRNQKGVTGIAPRAVSSVFSHTPDGSSGAIQRAADLLAPGDILVLEMHRPGPVSDFELRDDQFGYIAVEWWPDDLAAIQYATSQGIIVVEAAGNGAQNLDNDVYETPDYYFGDAWRNPFRSNVSGAILVGAGAPAGGSFGPPRSRLDFSNFGSRIDCQGWGEGVCTTGYGDLFRGRGEHEWYTARFNGTSSASPVVAGAIACLQGIAKARGQALSSDRIRELLRATGSLQPSPQTERIGNLPDLAALISAI